MFSLIAEVKWSRWLLWLSNGFNVVQTECTPDGEEECSGIDQLRQRCLVHHGLEAVKPVGALS